MFTLGVVVQTITQSSDRNNSTEGLLARTVESEGSDYVVSRDALISAMDADLNVKSISETSWELGLSAFIANSRRSNVKVFDSWEQQATKSALTARGTTFVFLPVSHNPAELAFLLELMWKFPNHSKAAYEDLRIGYNRLTMCPIDLWLSVWRNAEDRKFQNLALMGMALFRESNTAVYDELRSILKDPRTKVEHIGIILRGFWWSPNEDVIEIVKDGWPQLQMNESRFSRAAGILSQAQDKDSRKMLYAVIQNADLSLGLRHQVLGACTANPQDSDVEVIRGFLPKIRGTELEDLTIPWLSNYSYSEFGDMLWAYIEEESTWTARTDKVLRAIEEFYAKETTLDRESSAKEKGLLAQLKDIADDSPYRVALIEKLESELARLCQ
jgi:hypothetical protein